MRKSPSTWQFENEPVLLLLLTLIVLNGCSFRHLMVRTLVGSTEGLEYLYLSEDDPELVREAMPSNLKILELLISRSPHDPDLLLSAAQSFTVYGYAFVYRDAEVTMYEDIHAAVRIRRRAARLLSRAKGYAFRALEEKYPGFIDGYAANPVEALGRLRAEDTALIYWTAAAWGGLISASKDNPEAILELPNVGYFLERGLQLNESYDHGALHEMMISYSVSRPDAGSDAIDIARKHFVRAEALSAGKKASVYVSLAEAVSVRTQNREEFLQLLARAIEVDPDAVPSWRLANILAEERAVWLKERVDELFF